MHVLFRQRLTFAFCAVMGLAIWLAGCASNVGELRRDGQSKSISVRGDYEAVARCTLRLMERDQPSNDIGRSLADSLAFRHYPDQDTAEFFGPTDGWIIYVAEFRATDSSRVKTTITAQEMPPYTPSEVQAIVLKRVRECGDRRANVT
ncbi:hypothetical protein [Rhodovibrio sodomensis]|uniref:hypothetical protein n=1 Tax=Rhodovibrio sodomensis TaxID=1088 RepID=UPI001A914C7B|nr:hypothetical protein [Rhodovibrio sodomensis]